MSEPTTKKQRIDNKSDVNPKQSELRLTCEHIHVDTSIYDELINSANARFIVNNNKWLIINMQYIWEFLPHRVKFIKRAEIPTNEANNRLFQAVSDTDRHQVIFLGISAFYVLDTETWTWTITDNKIKAPINVPNYAANNFIFSYNNDSLFCGPLPFDGSLERIATPSPEKAKINFPWVSTAVLYNGDYYFVNSVQAGSDTQRSLMKLCMTKKEFIEVGSLSKRTMKLNGSFIFGFARENQLYFVSDANDMLIVSSFEETSKLHLRSTDLPASPYLPALARSGYNAPLCYYAFDGANLILFNKRKMAFVKLDLNTNTWSEPLIFEDYPPNLSEHAEGYWLPWKTGAVLLSCDQPLSTVFLFDAKTWKWTAKNCHRATTMYCESKEARYEGPTLTFSTMHAAIHEDALFVSGRVKARVFDFSDEEVHCLDLKTWTWTQITSYREHWFLKQVASLVVAKNTLYALEASVLRGQEVWDWIACDLETEKWTGHPSGTVWEEGKKTLIKSFQAAFVPEKERIYLMQNGGLATMSIINKKIEPIPGALLSPYKQFIQWDDYLVVVDEGRLLRCGRPETNLQEPIRFFDIDSNAFHETPLQGDDAHLYGHSCAVLLNDELFILGHNARSIVRLYKDVPVKSLQHLATTALCGYLDMDNVFALLDYAVNLRNRVLQQGCLLYLKNNTRKLMLAVEQINQLSDELKDILSVTFTYLPIK